MLLVASAQSLSAQPWPTWRVSLDAFYKFYIAMINRKFIAILCSAILKVVKKRILERLIWDKLSTHIRLIKPRRRVHSVRQVIDKCNDPSISSNVWVTRDTQLSKGHLLYSTMHFLQRNLPSVEEQQWDTPHWIYIDKYLRKRKSL